MKQYLDLLRDVRENGHVKSDRTGTGTLSVFGRQMRFNLQEGFPLVTTKKCHIRSIIHELLWFLKGDTNIQYLKDNNVSIWDEWAKEDGKLGPVYGKQWRDWVDTGIVYSDDTGANLAALRQGYTFLGEFFDHVNCVDVSVFQKSFDQISKVLEQLKNDPDNRRIIVSAWNVGELDQMALAPCHAFFQFYTRELTVNERLNWLEKEKPEQYAKRSFSNADWHNDVVLHDKLDSLGAIRRELSCQLYQRKLSCAF